MGKVRVLFLIFTSLIVIFGFAAFVAGCWVCADARFAADFNEYVNIDSEDHADKEIKVRMLSA